MWGACPRPLVRRAQLPPVPDAGAGRAGRCPAVGPAGRRAGRVAAGPGRSRRTAGAGGGCRPLPPLADGGCGWRGRWGWQSPCRLAGARPGAGARLGGWGDGAVTKSMSSSTRPSRLGSRSAYDVTAREDAAPRRQAGRPASPGRRRRPPSTACRGGRPARPRCPARPGRTACHTSTYGWPRTRTCGDLTCAADPRLLGAGHQVVDEHAEPALRARPRSRAPRPAGRRCRPAARRRRPRRAGRRPTPSRPARRRGGPRRRSGSPRATRARAPSTAHRPGGRTPGRRRRGRGDRPDQVDRRAVDQEARSEREDPVPAVPVLERHGAAAGGLLAPHDRAAEAGLGVLDHEVGLGRDPRQGPALRRAGRQHVTAVPVHACTASRAAAAAGS